MNILATPRAGFAELLRAPRRSDRVFAFALVEGLIGDPPAVARAIAGVWRRNLGALSALPTLLTTPLVLALIFTGLAAFVLRVTQHNPRKRDLGELFELAAWAFLPHIFMTLLFSAAWAFGAPLPHWSALADHAEWVLAYNALAWGGCVCWLVFAAQALNAPLVKVAGAEARGHSPWPARAVRGVVIVALGVMLGQVAHLWPTLQPVGKGDALQSFTVRDLESGSDRVFTFPRERRVVVDFWATWCGPCREALPGWQSLTGIDADLLSVNLEPTQGRDVMNFLAKKNYTFPVVTDGSGLQDKLQVDVLPTVVIIGRNGDIEKYWVGGASPAAIRAAIAP